MRKEQAAGLLNKSIKSIKITIKNKTGIYSLSSKPTLKKFIERLKTNDYEIVRNIPGNSDAESHLMVLLKDFLVEEAYFVQDARQYTRKIINSLLNRRDISENLCIDIDSFVKEKIEANRFERIKKFKEKSQFSTFLFTVVRRLFLEYLEVEQKTRSTIDKFGQEIIDNLYMNTVSPEEFNIGREEEEIKEKIAALLPQELNKLEIKEKIAFQLVHSKNITNISRISRDLGTTHYKANQIIKRAWTKVLAGIKKEIGGVFSKSGKISSNIDGGIKTKTPKRRQS